MLTASGKVRHRTFGKLLLLFPVFPRTALQQYRPGILSTAVQYADQAYFLQLYSTPTRHTFYSCTAAAVEVLQY